MKKMRLSSLALCLSPCVAGAEIITDSQKYSCDRGVTVPATYVGNEMGSAVVLNVEGRQIALHLEVADEGTSRYAWPSDGASYVWVAGPADAQLLWKEAGAETPLLTCTRAE